MAAQIGGRKVDQMGDGSSTLGPAPQAGADDEASTQPVVARAPVTAAWPADLPIPPPPRSPAELAPPDPVTDVVPACPPIEVRPLEPPVDARPPPPPVELQPTLPPMAVRPRQPPTEVRPFQPPAEVQPPPPPAGVRPFQPPTGIVRYGPGVPAAPSAQQHGLAAERVWRTGQPAVPGRRRPRPSRVLGSALTVILLAASGVALYLRLHHPPFHVTGVAIAQRTRAGCGVDVTGRIATNGGAGTVSYQWLFQPGAGSPQPLSQSVIAGQRAVYVTVAVEGSGHGRALQTVTLQVLGPDPTNASTSVVVSC